MEAIMNKKVFYSFFGLFMGIMFAADLGAKVPECSGPVPSSMEIEEDTYFSVIVDYGESLKNMVRDGNYHSVHPKIYKMQFYGTGTRAVPIRLIKFKRTTKFCQVISKFREMNVRPATDQELMNFRIDVEIRQNVKLNFTIVALGSFVEDYLANFLVPQLEDHADYRSLSLHRGDGYGWRSFTRFAVVPIDSKF